MGLKIFPAVLFLVVITAVCEIDKKSVGTRPVPFLDI